MREIEIEDSAREAIDRATLALVLATLDALAPALGPEAAAAWSVVRSHIADQPPAAAVASLGGAHTHDRGPDAPVNADGDDEPALRPALPWSEVRP